MLLLEDAAQAHVASLNGAYVGTWGTCAFSFYASKNMTTGEGGMILTHDADIARRLRLIRSQGASRAYHHEALGYNFRMTNLTAALGLVQLGRLSAWTSKRRDNAAYYNDHLQEVISPYAATDSSHVYHQYTVRVPENRDAMVQRLNAAGIEARVYYPTPLYQQPIFQDKAAYQNLHYPNTEQATREVLSLPVHPHLSDAERTYVVEMVNTLP